MNGLMTQRKVTPLNLWPPQDEIYREKLKIKKVADELGETFDDMLAHY
jgi:hypothetical protein